MESPIEIITHAGYTIEVWPDFDPENPREAWDNTATMACFHSRYTLGDKDIPFKSSDFNGWMEMQQHIIRKEKAIAVLPIFLMDHSGLWIQTTSFHDPWDSGRVGFIYLTKKQALKEFPQKPGESHGDYIARLNAAMKSEVSVYSDYLSGAVYGYVIKNPQGEHVDSCWGFYGDQKYMINEAKAIVDGLTKKTVPQMTAI